MAHLSYKGCLSLAREQVAAESLAAWVRPAEMKVAADRRRWMAWEDHVLLEANDAATAAEKPGRAEHGCSMRLWRLRTGRVPVPTNDQ